MLDHVLAVPRARLEHNDMLLHRCRSGDRILRLLLLLLRLVHLCLGPVLSDRLLRAKCRADGLLRRHILIGLRLRLVRLVLDHLSAGRVHHLTGGRAGSGSAAASCCTGLWRSILRVGLLENGAMSDLSLQCGGIRCDRMAAGVLSLMGLMGLLMRMRLLRRVRIGSRIHRVRVRFTDDGTSVLLLVPAVLTDWTPSRSSGGSPDV